MHGILLNRINIYNLFRPFFSLPASWDSCTYRPSSKMLWLLWGT